MSEQAATKTVQVYLFGRFAQKIQPHLTNREPNNIYWEIAVYYLDELKESADDYSKLPTEKRAKYLKKQNLGHKNYS